MKFVCCFKLFDVTTFFFFCSFLGHYFNDTKLSSWHKHSVIYSFVHYSLLMYLPSINLNLLRDRFRALLLLPLVLSYSWNCIVQDTKKYSNTFRQTFVFHLTITIGEEGYTAMEGRPTTIDSIGLDLWSGPLLHFYY